MRPDVKGRKRADSEKKKVKVKLKGPRWLVLDAKKWELALFDAAATGTWICFLSREDCSRYTRLRGGQAMTIEYDIKMQK